MRICSLWVWIKVPTEQKQVPGSVPAYRKETETYTTLINPRSEITIISQVPQSLRNCQRTNTPIYYSPNLSREWIVTRLLASLLHGSFRGGDHRRWIRNRQWYNKRGNKGDGCASDQSQPIQQEWLIYHLPPSGLILPSLSCFRGWDCTASNSRLPCLLVSYWAVPRAATFTIVLHMFEVF